MSNQPVKPTKSLPSSIKKIEVGEFHVIHDGSPGGHPGYVVWKDDLLNIYLLVKVGSSPNKNNEKLNTKLSEKVESHYYYKRPFLAKRKDIGTNPVTFLSPTEEFKEIAERLKTVDPLESKSIKRKDRYNFKKLQKNRPKTGVPLVKGNCPANNGPA